MTKRRDDVRPFSVGIRRSKNRLQINAKSQKEAISKFHEITGHKLSTENWTMVTARPIKAGETPIMLESTFPSVSDRSGGNLR